MIIYQLFFFSLNNTLGDPQEISFHKIITDKINKNTDALKIYLLVPILDKSIVINT